MVDITRQRLRAVTGIRSLRRGHRHRDLPGACLLAGLGDVKQSMAMQLALAIGMFLIVVFDAVNDTLCPSEASLQTGSQRCRVYTSTPPPTPALLAGLGMSAC